MKQAELDLLAIRLPQIATREIDAFVKLQVLVEMLSQFLRHNLRKTCQLILVFIR